MNCNLDDEVYHSHQTTTYTYINLNSNSPHNEVQLLHLASSTLTTLTKDTILKLLLQPRTTLNLQLLANDHPYTCNCTTEKSKLTFTGSNTAEFHDTAKMEKQKHNSIRDIWSVINM